MKMPRVLVVAFAILCLSLCVGRVESVPVRDDGQSLALSRVSTAAPTLPIPMIASFADDGTSTFTFQGYTMMLKTTEPKNKWVHESQPDGTHIQSFSQGSALTYSLIWMPKISGGIATDYKLTISGTSQTNRQLSFQIGLVRGEYSKVGNRVYAGQIDSDTGEVREGIGFDWSDAAGFLDSLDDSKARNEKTVLVNFKIPKGSFSIDPSTVGTSTAGTAGTAATQHPQQRKMCYQSSLFWFFYSDGTNIVYVSSSDGLSWSSATNVNATTLGGPAFLTFCDGTTYIHYACAPNSAGNALNYRRGTAYSNGTIIWETKATAVAAVANIVYQRPSIALDSSSHAWITYRWRNNTDATIYPYVTANANTDGTWSTAAGLPYQLSTVSNNAWDVSLAGLTSGKMQVVYTQGSMPLMVQAWSGSAWQPVANTTSSPSSSVAYSSVAESDNVHTVFRQLTTNNLLYSMYSYTTNSWGAEVTVQAAVTGTSNPVLSLDTVSGDLYCFWAGSPAANHIYYSKYTAATGLWDAAATDWVTEVSITNNAFLTGFRTSFSSYIGLGWMNGTSSPYNIRFGFLTMNSAPTNDGVSLDLTGASYKGAKTLLTAKEDYNFTLKVSDADGVADLNYAEIRLDPSGKDVRLRWTESTGVFSEQSDPSNYVTLNAAASSHYTTGNQKVLKFYVTINWAWGDSAETVTVRAYALDDASASDTDDYANIFGVEAHLTSANLAGDDYRCNPSQTLTMSGNWFYDGTTTAPPDGDYQVIVKLVGVQKGSTDTTLVSGAFSISDVTAESSITSYSYTVEASQMSGAGSFSSVTVDRLKVAGYTVSDSRTDLATNVDIDATVVYESDNTAVTTGILTINGAAAFHQGAGVYRITDTSAVVASKTYNTVAGSETSYSLNTVNQNGKSTTVVWDRIEVYAISANATAPTTLPSASAITVTLVYEFDNSTISTGAFTLNSTALTYVAAAGWRVNITETNGHSHTYNLVAGTDGTYSLTIVNMNGKSVTVDWTTCTRFLYDSGAGATGTIVLSGGPYTFASGLPFSVSATTVFFNLTDKTTTLPSSQLQFRAWNTSATGIIPVTIQTGAVRPTYALNLTEYTYAWPNMTLRTLLSNESVTVDFSSLGGYGFKVYESTGTLASAPAYVSNVLAFTVSDSGAGAGTLTRVYGAGRAPSAWTLNGVPPAPGDVAYVSGTDILTVTGLGSWVLTYHQPPEGSIYTTTPPSSIGTLTVAGPVEVVEGNITNTELHLSAKMQYPSPYTITSISFNQSWIRSIGLPKSFTPKSEVTIPIEVDAEHLTVGDYMVQASIHWSVPGQSVDQTLKVQVKVTPNPIVSAAGIQITGIQITAIVGALALVGAAGIMLRRSIVS